MARSTTHDVAKEADVSLATVDRVLNARPGVRQKTVDRVNLAVKKLGYVRDISAANLARQRQYKFAFILPENDSQFIQSLKTGIGEAADALSGERTDVEVYTVPSNDPHSVVRLLDRLGRSNIDGVALMAPETPQLRDAVAHLKSDNVAVVALVSNLPNSGVDHFVGINNVAAGRTAAVLMGRFSVGQTGKILVVADSIQSRDSLDRRLGFDDMLADRFEGLSALPSIETYGDAERAESIVSKTVSENPEICGVYILGSGIQAVVNALAQPDSAASKVVVAHELTSFTRQALADGSVDVVITQDVGHLARSSLRILQAKSDRIATIPAQERIRIEIIIHENLT